MRIIQSRFCQTVTGLTFHAHTQARYAQIKPLLFHTALEQQVEGTRHVPLHHRCSTKTHAQYRGPFIETVDTLHFQRRPDVVAHHRILTQLLSGFLHQRDGVINSHGVRDADSHQGDSKMTRHVMDRLDGAESNDVQDAVEITQAYCPHRQAFNGAHVAIDLHKILHRQGVLDQDKDPGNQVLHQGLGAKAHGQADDTGTRQQWSYIDPQVGQSDNRGNNHDGGEYHVTQHRGNGLRPSLIDMPATRTG